MRFCGVKTTHDGGVALIDDGQLVFSYEMEKLDNRSRYDKIEDLSMVFALLADHGYEPGSIDHFVFDGWHKTHKLRLWFGQEVEIVLAPYRSGLVGDDVFEEFQYRVLDLPYLTYTHYAGHVASAYCTSPFASSGESAYVLSWDGLMFPYLYFVDFRTGKAQSLGALFPLIGDTYHTLAQHYQPFDRPIDFPHVLGLAGKIMAYEALGSASDEALRYLKSLSTRAYQTAIGNHRHGTDRYLQMDLGADILRLMNKELSIEGVGDADMIASVHAFLENELLSGLRARLRSADFENRNLCVVGGCGLNIKWNRAIRSSGLFDNVWVPPFPNDSGSAIGAACCAMLGRTDQRCIGWNVYSGPPLKLPRVVDGWLSEECDVEGLAKVIHRMDEPVVFLNGKAELGPRALGNRSILAPVGDARTRDVLNQIKDRESYRPVAPMCLEHRAPEIFDPGSPDPYMLFDHAVRRAWRERIAAVCHLDGTARLQTVNQEQNPIVFDLLTAYERLSGLPLLCNTSANWKDRGFFPDVESAMRWGRVNLIWSDSRLYSRVGVATNLVAALTGTGA